MNTRWVACVAVSLCAAIAYSQAPGQPITTSGTKNTVSGSAMAGPGPVVKWDYSVQTKDEVAKLGGGEVRAGLNKLGDGGWELVSVTEVALGSTFYFKRARGHMPMGMMGMGMPGMGVAGIGGPVMQGGLPAGVRAAGGQGSAGPMPGGGAGGRGGAGPMPPPADERVAIYPLKFAKASPTAKLLKEIYGERAALRIASDERTNSLILAGQDEQLAKVEAILVKLDHEVAEERGKK